VPPLTITIEVPWPKHSSLLALEKTIFRALMAAGRALLVQAFTAIEELALIDAGARQRKRRRYLLTRFGELRFTRWQTRGPGGYRHPLDDALGLEPKEQCSPWVKQKASWLAQAHPFRQAAALLSDMIGCRVDHRRLWGWVQGIGIKVRHSWEDKRRALFEDGELPEPRGPAPEIVSAGVDGTFIHTRDGPIEVKLGIWWTGAQRTSETARHPRFVRQQPGCYATTDEHDAFGQTLYVLADDAVSISRATDVFAISDGAGWCPDVLNDWLRPTHHQLDHFHGRQRITEVAKDPERAARWWGWVCDHNLQALGRSIDAYTRAGKIDLTRPATWSRISSAAPPPCTPMCACATPGIRRRWRRAVLGWSSTTSISSSPAASSARGCAVGAGRGPTTCSPCGSSPGIPTRGDASGVMPWPKQQQISADSPASLPRPELGGRDERISLKRR